MQAAVTFGCIPVADDEVCFDRVAGLQDGYDGLSLTLVGLYTYNMNTYIFNSFNVRPMLQVYVSKNILQESAHNIVYK